MSNDYQLGMGFVTVFVSIMYIVVHAMEMDERHERAQRASLNQHLKF
jgi:Na+-transporting methylmalonyl-CoA/oxaloacetate decarboxylase gamma subunit